MPRLTKSAEKQLKKLPKEVQAKAEEIINRIDNEPRLSKKLHGKLEGNHVVRLGRAYRIIYYIESDMKVIQSISSRKDAYRK